MRLLGKHKKSEFKIKNIEFVDESDLIKSPEVDLEYDGVNILISSNSEESVKHIQKDFDTLKRAGIEKLIKEYFIPWLKGEKHQDLEDNEVYNGLKIAGISYQYHRIIGKYSPTGEDGYFGEFEFDFKSSNNYTKDLLQASAFVVLVDDGKIYHDRNYDI